MSESKPNEFQDQPTLQQARNDIQNRQSALANNEQTIAFPSLNESTPGLHTPTDKKQSSTFDQPTLPPNVGLQSASTTGDPRTSRESLSRSRASFTSLQNELPRPFGDYLLLTEIARGGMGVVYKAKQERLNRIVAVKMILTGQLAGNEDVLRFYAEAEAAANLNHQGIVPIYEVGQTDGQHFFSMGFVDGPSLANLIAERPIEPNEAAILAVQTAEAISYAHSKGVIHRDLKPANVLLDRIEGSSSNSLGTLRASRYGRPKVTDFGLAKQIASRSELTATGQILGTPGYMPPEQAAGKTNEVGELADVYSLGGVLYAMLTGMAPFQAATPIDTLIQVLEREPTPPRQSNSKIPVDLETICLKCLQKDQKRRYQSAMELVNDLNRFLDGSPILARPVTNTERLWRWAKKHPTVAALSCFCATLLLVIVIAAPIIALRQAQLRMAESRAKNNAISVSEQLAVAKDEAEASHYSANISLAYSLWSQGSLNRARYLLNEAPHRFRNWEWWFLDRLCAGNVVPLRGNAAEVPEVRFRKDGRLLGLTTSAIGRQWDIETGFPCDPIKIGAVKCSFDRYAERIVSWTDEEVFTIETRTSQPKRSFFVPGSPVITCVHALDSVEIAVLRKSANASETIVDDFVSLEIANGDDGEIIVVIDNLPASINPKLALSPSANLFAYVADGNSIFWGEKSQQWKSKKLEFDDYKVTQLCFSPKSTLTEVNEMLTLACSDGVIRNFRLDESKSELVLESQLETSGAEVTALAWNSDGRWLTAGSNDRQVSLWRHGETNSRSIYRGIDAKVNSLCFSEDSQYLAAGTAFGVKAWRIMPGYMESKSSSRRGLARQDSETIPVSIAPLTDVCVSSDQRSCCVVDEANRIYQIDSNTWKFKELPIRSWLKGLQTESPFEPPKWTDGIPVQAELSPDGRVLAFTIAHLVDSTSLDVPVRVKSSIVLWDLVSQIPLRVLGEHDNLVNCMAFSPDGQSLVAGTGFTSDANQIIKQLSRVGSRTDERPNVVRVWDVSTGLLNLELNSRSENYTVVTFSQDGQDLFCSGDFASIEVWNWQSKRLIKEIATPSAITPSQLQYAELPAGVAQRLGEITKTSEIELGKSTITSQDSLVENSLQSADVALEKESAKRVDPQQHANPSNALPADRLPCLLTSGTDGFIRVYDAKTGELYRILEGHSNRATGVIAIDQGKRIVSCSEDGSVRVWDPVFGTELLSLPHDGRMVRGVVWLPITHSLLTISNAGVLWVWQSGEDNPPDVDRWQDILEADKVTESDWAKSTGQWTIEGRKLIGVTTSIGTFQGVGEMALARIDLKDQLLPDTLLLEFDLILNKKNALQIIFNDKNENGEVVELSTAPNPFTQRAGIAISKRGDLRNLKESVANPSVLLTMGKSHKVRILRNPHSLTVSIDGDSVLRTTLATTLDCSLSMQSTFGPTGSTVTIDNLSIRSSKPAIERRDAWKTIRQWSEEELIAPRIKKRIDENDSWSFELKRLATRRAKSVSVDQSKVSSRIEEWLKSSSRDISQLVSMLELSGFMIDFRNRWLDWLHLAFCKEISADYHGALDAIKTSIEICKNRNGHAMPSHWGLVAICNHKLGRMEQAKRALIMANRSLVFSKDDPIWDATAIMIRESFGEESDTNGLSNAQQKLLDFVMKNNLPSNQLYTEDFVYEFVRIPSLQPQISQFDRRRWLDLAAFLERPGTIGLDDYSIYDYNVEENTEAPEVTLYAIRERLIDSNAIFKFPRWQNLKICFTLTPSESSWRIAKQSASVISAKYTDKVYDFTDGGVLEWDRFLDDKLRTIKSKSRRERGLLAEQLLMAYRERDAIRILRELKDESQCLAEDLVLLSLAALQSGEVTLARTAAEEAIDRKPSITGPKYLEKIALAKFGQFDRVSIGKNFYANVPRSWKLMSKNSFIGADNMQVGWLIDLPQACVSTLYKIDDSTREQFMAQIQSSNDVYKRTVIEEKNLKIADVDAYWLEVEGMGNGGVIDGQGSELTSQVMCFIFLEREILLLTVVSPQADWPPLKKTFADMVDSISNKPASRN